MGTDSKPGTGFRINFGNDSLVLGHSGPIADRQGLGDAPDRH
jgi:hypothetical protein